MVNIRDKMIHSKQSSMCVYPEREGGRGGGVEGGGGREGGGVISLARGFEDVSKRYGSYIMIPMLFEIYAGTIRTTSH